MDTKIKKIDTEEAKKIVRVIEHIHRNNSDLLGGGEYYVLKNLNPTKDEEWHDEDFEIFKSALVSRLETLRKGEYLSKEDSFIILKDKDYTKQNRKLKLKEYLEIIKDSKGFFNYLLKLVEFGEKINCWITFYYGEIGTFCSKYFYLNFKYNSYLIDIKEIEPKEYWYPHKNEKERFWEIDKLWSECKERDAIRKSREFLTYYLESARGKTFSEDKGNKKKEIEEVLCQITSTFKIEGLSEDLNIILCRFREIRNKLGKTEASEGEEQKRLVEKFENSPHKSISTKLLIDLLKALHNALIVMEKISKENK